MLLLNIKNLSPAKQRMVEAMQDGATGPAEIARDAEVAPETVKHYIREMMRDGILSRTARGCYIVDCFVIGKDGQCR